MVDGRRHQQQLTISAGAAGVHVGYNFSQQTTTVSQYLGRYYHRDICR